MLSQPKKPLCKHSSQAAVLWDVDNIFNVPTPATQSCGWSPTPMCNTSNSPPPILPFHKSSSPSIRESSHHQSFATLHTHCQRKHAQSSSQSSSIHQSSPTLHTHHQSKCAQWSSRSSSTGPSNQLLKCKWRDGKAPTGRPGARDYEPEVTSLILELICEYGALLVTNNPVPLPDEQITWATQECVWKGWQEIIWVAWSHCRACKLKVLLAALDLGLTI